jgi:archaellum component FlaF (FlaF/FlaG flagellin family)
MTYLSIIDAWRLIFNMRFVKNRRRALSTAVSMAIMLTAVVAIGTGVVAWSNTSLRTYEFNLATSASDKTNKINEMLIIENVVLQPNGAGPGLNAINITVTNIGTVGLNVTQIQVSDPTPLIIVKNVNLCAPKCSTTGAITPHSSGWFWYAYQWTANKIDTIQVTTGRGTVITTQAMHQ